MNQEKSKSVHTYKICCIASMSSGAGKTTICMGLAAALVARGLNVQTCKIGPDYIDGGYLSKASGIPCRNIDSILTSPGYIRRTINDLGAIADILLIEGVMGIYDSKNPCSNDGSTASIVKLLNIPLVLIASAAGCSRTAAAQIYGIVHFPDAPNINGIILNHCSSIRHAGLVTSACRSVHLPPIIGVIMKNSLPSLASRHLGLYTIMNQSTGSEDIGMSAQVIESSINIPGFIGSLPDYYVNVHKKQTVNIVIKKVKVVIACAYDDAFQFYYHDNIELLRTHGADIRYFSPLTDDRVPESTEFIYIGGGYPEEYAQQLGENTAMVQSVQNAYMRSIPIYAECGGLMYCCRGITQVDNTFYPMLDILPCTVKMSKRLMRLGYCTATLNHDSFLGAEKSKVNGHEFHYSYIDSDVSLLKKLYTVTYSDGTCLAEGILYNSVCASYIHCHWGETQSIPLSIVNYGINRKL